jgi:enediyne biosynthesis protein E4
MTDLRFVIAVLGLLSFNSSSSLPADAPQQQPAVPAQAPVRSGRPYTSGDLKSRPAVSAPVAQSPVTFADITSQSGIMFKYNASPTSQKYLLESMGGGVAMLDYDDDGRLDLFFTNGANLIDPMPKGAMPDKSDSRYWNRLYRQKADGSFEDVTERAGVRGEGYSMGAAVADYDSDGRVDIFVTGYGGNTLYRNSGDGTFKDVTSQSGVRGAGWSTSAGWLDYDRDGRLDLFVARYAEWDFEIGSIYCGEARPGFRAYCHPDNFKGASNLLYHQRADGTFEDVSAASKIASSGFCGAMGSLKRGRASTANWNDSTTASSQPRRRIRDWASAVAVTRCSSCSIVRLDWNVRFAAYLSTSK